MTEIKDEGLWEGYRRPERRESHHCGDSQVDVRVVIYYHDYTDTEFRLLLTLRKEETFETTGILLAFSQFYMSSELPGHLEFLPKVKVHSEYCCRNVGPSLELSGRDMMVGTSLSRGEMIKLGEKILEEYKKFLSLLNYDTSLETLVDALSSERL